MVKLSEATRIIVDKLFSPEQRAEAGQLLEEECGNNLPFCANSDEYDLERVRFAVLKLSEGEINKLKDAIKLARIDWRDALMAAGFGQSISEHKEWERGVKGAT